MSIQPEMAQAIQQWLEQWSRCGITHIPGRDLRFDGQIVSSRSSSEPIATVVSPAIAPPSVSPLPVEKTEIPSPASAPTKAVPPVPASGDEPSLADFDAQPKAAPVVRHTAWQTAPLPIADRETAFTILKSEVAACQRCTEIACSRTQTVFGVGNLTPKIAFFGEAPGQDEDKQGIPFVGKAGQLLDRIIAASKLRREDVYILNSLRCRPPNNRTPSELEIENCRPFFEKQLEVLQPEYIVCLGAVAVRSVLQSTESVGRLRGRFHSFRGAKVLVTYHPAYLLRNESAKKLTWEDMQMLMREIGLL